MDLPVGEYAALCQYLCGADRPINVKSAFPEGVTYILLALRNTQPASGLDGLVVCSGLFRDADAPPALVLLPSGSVWAKVDSKCTFKILENTGEKPSSRYLDLDPAVKQGCTRFVTMGLALDDQAATVAAVVGFLNDDAAQRASRFAEDLLAAAKAECEDSVHSVLKIAAVLLSPQSTFPSEDYRSDDESDSWDEDEWTRNNRAAVAPSHVQQPSKWTLAFQDPWLEERFRNRHAMAMFKFDALGYMFIIFCAIFIIFLPGTAFHLIQKDAGIRVSRSAISALPALLFLTPKTRVIYRRHRELLLAWSFLATTHWELHVQHYMNAVDAAVFTRPLYALGYSWLPIMVLLFQLRFRFAVPLTALCFGLDATLLPLICRTFYQTQALNTCVAINGVRMFCMAFLFPLALLWRIEGHARKVYVRIRTGER